MSDPSSVYRPRKPQDSQYYQCVEDHFETLEPRRGGDERFAKQYGFFRPYVRQVIPSILEPDGSSGEYKRNWARLIQKIYEVDPLTCPKCSGKMKVISMIEDENVTRLPRLVMTLWALKRSVEELA